MDDRPTRRWLRLLLIAVGVAVLVAVAVMLLGGGGDHNPFRHFSYAGGEAWIGR